MLFATNSTTNKIELFEDMKTVEFEKFARQAVFDFCIGCFDGDRVVTGVNNKIIEINENSSDFDFWVFCAILYCKCKTSGNWEGILTINEIIEEEE
jgi:hypothetical protein